MSWGPVQYRKTGPGVWSAGVQCGAAKIRGLEQRKKQKGVDRDQVEGETPWLRDQSQKIMPDEGYPMVSRVNGATRNLILVFEGSLSNLSSQKIRI